MGVDTSHGHPAMDYREHERTYKGFLKGAIWLTGLTIAVLVFLAIVTL